MLVSRNDNTTETVDRRAYNARLLFVKIISNTARNLHNDLLRTIIA